MATKFTMIAPFDQASGNVSGKQLLKYAENNNPAYDSPVGRVNYARNYRTRYVAGIRSATGEGYIQVKKKSAVHLTQRAKLNMALLGGTGAIFGSIMRDKSSELYANLYAQWLELQNNGSKKTFRESVCDAIRAGLIAKLEQIPYSGPRGVVYITNPWNYTGSTPNVTVSTETLVKFWTELAANPVTFTVDGLKGVAHGGTNGDAFTDIITRGLYNVLGLTIGEIPGGVATGVYMGDGYLTYNSTPIEGEDNPTNNRDYSLTIPTD